ncbi:hypothetical protein BpHYR1_033012 [Brachionus plicatilis]|uniref:Uncharacterized protein n=1 Tax=Brachionus plicatilis TaxID=10195 RepID=A0A3M7PTX6_BRAPC|nr:hypothetical protein BpHYR1_033012 [Brachionus plicatilis]
MGHNRSCRVKIGRHGLKKLGFSLFKHGSEFLKVTKKISVLDFRDLSQEINKPIILWLVHVLKLQLNLTFIRGLERRKE